MTKRKAVPRVRPAPLLVEVLTEELPPNALLRLSDAFGAGLADRLQKEDFTGMPAKVEVFATPRRLAVRISDVLPRQPDRETSRRGPPVTAALDAAGKPTAALEGFARSCGVKPAQLARLRDEKGEYFVFRSLRKGEGLAAHLARMVDESLKALSAPRLMRWGSHEVQFVRPVHGLLMLHGAKLVPGEVMGIRSTSSTRGHRFFAAGPIRIASAASYEKLLKSRGRVIPAFADRKADILAQVRKLETQHKVHAVLDPERTKFNKALSRRTLLSCNWELAIARDELLDETTALVEYPVVRAGRIDEAFLELPLECLTLSMRRHQRYFPCFDRQGRLAPLFLFVSNSGPKLSPTIVRGNERVLRARLSDARFFYTQDRRTRLEDRVPRLADVVFHNRLGSQLERVERIQLLAGKIARETGADPLLVERAAWLCKADLLTDMVREFPELQGTIGRYYAVNDGEPEPVAEAIETHYRPRHAGDAVPVHPVAAALALADKLEALAGMFGIGQTPTGDRDPFGLRRAAFGVIRILVDNRLPLDLYQLVDAAFACHGRQVKAAPDALLDFMFERLASHGRDNGHSTLEVDAVLSQRPRYVHLVPSQLDAVSAFNRLPEAESLAAANKRVVNILRQADERGERYSDTRPDTLCEPAERELHDALRQTSTRAAALFDDGDFTGYLKSFAVLKAPVDRFFDSVMVMADDPALRRSRLALLSELRAQMNRVADISRLAK